MVGYMVNKRTPCVQVYMYNWMQAHEFFHQDAWEYVDVDTVTITIADLGLTRKELLALLQTLQPQTKDE